MAAAKKTGSKRREVKALIEKLRESYDRVDKSIFAAASNVNLDSILGWQKDGVKHSYLEEPGPSIRPSGCSGTGLVPSLGIQSGQLPE